MERCPSPKPKCKLKAYVVAGDVLVAYEVAGHYSRVEFVSAKGRSYIGWLENEGLLAVPASPAVWTGSWQATEHTIAITTTRKSGQFRASGDATWGAGDPDRVARGGVNMGQFAGNFVPAKDRATVEESGDSNGCRVKLRLLGPYLVTSDNLNCGGHNVSFSGALRKTGR
jgi:hypothetical protein